MVESNSSNNDLNRNFSSIRTNEVTESVIALNQIVLGSAAPTAMAGIQIAMAHANGVGAQNLVACQQHLNIMGAAAVAAGTGTMLWEGLTRNVDNITINDRLKYWQELMTIATGAAAPAAKEDADKNTGTEEEA
ncbi:RebB family R body protein [Sneathiella sp.]|jgi:hypothetical protein|uniref:RebB family R body protein n=1 Tax=Sneathiella sp. TaxID=1964365 RepID=UPI0039E4AC97